MAKEDDEYPDWLWTLLDKPERKEGMVEGEDTDLKGESVLVPTFSPCKKKLWCEMRARVGGRRGAGYGRF
jgi:hypothetical protein